MGNSQAEIGEGEPLRTFEGVISVAHVTSCRSENCSRYALCFFPLLYVNKTGGDRSLGFKWYYAQMNITSDDCGMDFVGSFYCGHVVFVGKMINCGC